MRATDRSRCIVPCVQTKVLEYGTSPYTPTAAAVGTLVRSGETPRGFAKLSDADINTIAGTNYYVRVQSSFDTNYAYMKIDGIPFTDTARAFGWSGRSYGQEVASSFASASSNWKTGSHCGARFDTECAATGNNHQRWFADYSVTPHCYGRSNSQRCFSSGSTTGHAMRQHATVWVRSQSSSTCAPPSLPSTQGCSTNEAEGATASGVTLKTTYAGFTGSGFMEFNGNIRQGSYLQWSVTATEVTKAMLRWRYALGDNSRPLRLSVNGVNVDTVEFDPTGGWTTWKKTAKVAIELRAGTNTIRITSTGDSGANIDSMELCATPRSVVVTLGSAGAYKLCHSKVANPSQDGHFSLVAGVTVHANEPGKPQPPEPSPPPPLPPPPPPPLLPCRSGLAPSA